MRPQSLRFRSDIRLSFRQYDCSGNSADKWYNSVISPTRLRLALLARLFRRDEDSWGMACSLLRFAWIEPGLFALLVFTCKVCPVSLLDTLCVYRTPTVGTPSPACGVPRRGEEGKSEAQPPTSPMQG